ncbi:hypothetical protein GGR56DRAFT_582684 [Xylariaceae sp. FL0804]|nr:hypothetical protein GGR56DRAFT_582684 [Xylariaceae sp. FL0804]
MSGHEYARIGILLTGLLCLNSLAVHHDTRCRRSASIRQRFRTGSFQASPGALAPPACHLRRPFPTYLPMIGSLHRACPIGPFHLSYLKLTVYARPTTATFLLS